MKNAFATMRRSHKLTLATLSKETGLSISYLSDLEHSRTEPSVQTLRTLATCYETTIANLIEEEQPEETKTFAAEPIYKAIGDRIRAERKELGFTQAELAAEIGLSRPSLNNIEQGCQRILIHNLEHIARALGVPIGDLLPQRNETTS